MWIGPREIRYAVTFGGVLRFVASAGFPFKGRNRWQSEREREPSLSSLLHLRELAPSSSPARRRASKVFILVASFHRLLRQRRAQAPRRRHHPLNARFTRATHVSPPNMQSAPSPVRRFHVSWFSDCSAVRSALEQQLLQFGRFLRRSGSPQPASLLAARQKMSMTNEQRPL